jgi:glucosylceramidase
VVPSGEALQVTAAENPDGSLAVVVFNPGMEPLNVSLSLGGRTAALAISPQALQTILIKP